jgi:Fe-S cluster assembly iron-binding protein IscA
LALDEPKDEDKIVDHEGYTFVIEPMIATMHKGFEVDYNTSDGFMVNARD